jgi:glycosyltransferase involved in cell wall biosynthesis
MAGRSAVYAWDNDRSADRFKRKTLIEGTSEAAPRGEIGRRLERTLDDFKPEVVVVPGWASPAAWAALRWCARHGVAAIGMSESTAWDEPRVGWKEAVKQRLVRQFASALVGGKRHQDYLVQLGMAKDRIFPGYDAVDNRHFTARADAIRANPDHARQKHGLPENYFLASARFVDKKNLPRLLEAYARYRSLCGTTAWSLVLLGDGELRADLEQKREALGLRDYILMPGFKQYDELSPFYGLAGAFIHPSTVEPWGLVVNEAAASALPLLVSDRCGCAPELVRDGINGFTFDPRNTEEMAKKMEKISASDFPRADFGSRSLEIVAEWGPERFSQGLSQAMEGALRRAPVAPGGLDRALLGILATR